MNISDNVFLNLHKISDINPTFIASSVLDPEIFAIISQHLTNFPSYPQEMNISCFEHELKVVQKAIKRRDFHYFSSKFCIIIFNYSK